MTSHMTSHDFRYWSHDHSITNHMNLDTGHMTTALPIMGLQVVATHHVEILAVFELILHHVVEDGDGGSPDGCRGTCKHTMNMHTYM